MHTLDVLSVTAFGSAWRETETCLCPMLNHQRNTIVCADCGTVYAVAKIKTYRSGWSRFNWETDFGTV